MPNKIKRQIEESMDEFFKKFTYSGDTGFVHLAPQYANAGTLIRHLEVSQHSLIQTIIEELEMMKKDSDQFVDDYAKGVSRGLSKVITLLKEAKE